MRQHQASDGGAPAARLRVRVQPKASRNAVIVEEDGRVRVALTAPPVDGAANSALISLVADLLGVSKRSVALEQGAKSREKVLAIQNLSTEEVFRRLKSKTEGGSCKT